MMGGYTIQTCIQILEMCKLFKITMTIYNTLQLKCFDVYHDIHIWYILMVYNFNVYSPWAKPFRGVIRPESSPHVFLLTKTLNLKKKSGGHLSVVAFGSERPVTENIYTF